MSYEAEQLWQELLSKDEIDDENLFGETSSDEYQPSDNMTDSDSDSGIKRPKSEKSLTASVQDLVEGSQPSTSGAVVQKFDAGSNASLQQTIEIS
ncbi:unnamed protein product [Acanthoscelides obtectus]|uniref:Uncharacterized protein n=1 Tax=Acanthoscelides obtectus TaxID=200917 RepID=A0A9P0MFA4_ACAOB|nr:unnamed protein product [Acanthoscelides obtectus]CAK1622485.1 hypothetical protein AOBTE_LOCUS1513 [Acanthoscelides obtectus]